ncbi:MAG: hypothetical protein IPL53_18760 [Ignavibacteria bacterium]|nr:hypothetical protein [Ignavibacteria bacterium]
MACNYYIALSDYGLGTASMVKEDNAGLKKYTQSGIDVINKSIDEYPEFADSFVLLEALNFNRWQYEQEKMQEIIAATGSADESAAKLDKNNPRLLMLNGMSSFIHRKHSAAALILQFQNLKNLLMLLRQERKLASFILTGDMILRSDTLQCHFLKEMMTVI